MPGPRSPIWIPSHAPSDFPDPREFHAQGLIAGGGDLSPERLLAAYRAGIFPWYDKPPILWWSPDPRAIITPRSLHISRSLRRRLLGGQYRVTYNRDPEGVMIGCSDRLDGTWLNSAMKTAYLALRDAGHLISFEVWDHSFVQESEPAPLVGGLYGILVDGVFAAESKFHRKTDASKVALVCAVSELFAAGLQLFDVQFLTQHLSTLGVFEINRTRYLRALEAARSHNVRLSASPEDLIPAAVERLGLKSVPAKEPGFS